MIFCKILCLSYRLEAYRDIGYLSFKDGTKVARADLDSENGIRIFYTTFCQSICYIGLRKE